jgi:hypothetical protein
VRGFLEATPVLAKEVAAVTRHEIELKNGIILAVHSNSFRTVRGRTLVAAIFDEVAFWRDESSASPDVETYTAVLPSLATTNGMLVGISSPYRQLGLLHQKHRDHFGVDGDVLVVQGASTVFNPTLSVATIEAQRQADPAAAISEWDAEFRIDISAFLDDELIDRAVEFDRPLELPRIAGACYQAFTDPSGGTGGDSYTVTVAHKRGEHAVVDVLHGTTGKFDPEEVTREYAALLRVYGIHQVVGDEAARAEHAERLAQAATAGTAPQADGALRAARAALADAEDQLPAARSAFEQLKTGGAEVADAAAGAKNNVLVAVSEVLKPVCEELLTRAQKAKAGFLLLQTTLLALTDDHEREAVPAFYRSFADIGARDARLAPLAELRRAALRLSFTDADWTAAKQAAAPWMQARAALRENADAELPR